MPQLSAFIITKNEAQDIGPCIESLHGIADEIVVVDDQSTDETVTVCRQLGAKVFHRALEGFGAQKQFALDQTTGDWAFSIDADERVTPALAQEIQRLLGQTSTQAGYAVRRDFFFLGHHLRFGGMGSDWVVRLFKRQLGRFRDVRVHEGLQISGPVGRLSAPLDHFSYDSLQEYMDKCNLYTTLAAQDQWHRGRRFSRADHLRPLWEMFLRVVLRGAWLDGRAGLIYAALSAHASWLRAIKLWEMERKRMSTQQIQKSESIQKTPSPLAGEGRGGGLSPMLLHPPS